MSKHAYLSASSSHRWLNCPPSAKLNAEAEQTTAEYARQGTDCHELCAYLVEAALGRDVADPTENLDYYDSEMQQCAEEYRNFVLEQIEKAKSYCSDPVVCIEQRLDFSRWVKDGFGTGDCVIVADEELQIIDYKHGVGVLVEPDGHVSAAGGLIAQLLPGASEEAVEFAENVSRTMKPVSQLVKEGNSAEEIIKMYFPDAVILEKRDVRWHCGCSRERFMRSLALLNNDDLQEMIDDGRGAEIRCQYCGHYYNFDTEDLKLILGSKLRA